MLTRAAETQPGLDSRPFDRVLVGLSILVLWAAVLARERQNEPELSGDARTAIGYPEPLRK